MPLREQFFRYAIVGIVSNIIIYLLYLLITWIGIGHKIAMTSLYIISVLQSFIFNKSWSFHYQGTLTPALFRYVAAYSLGYIINLLALLIFVDQVGLPHQWVQGVMIMVVAAMLFLAQIYWVFPSQPKGNIA